MTIEAGKRVRAVKDLPYVGGQAPEDKICQGELLTVERQEGSLLYFKEHADRYGGWPASEFIPDGMFWCPSCENAVSEVYLARSVKKVWNGSDWIETDVYNEALGCPICCDEVDESDLQTFGMEMRDRTFYTLSEEDILNVAGSLEVQLTDEEMTRVKDQVSDGLGNHWWDVTETVIDEILEERRTTEDGS